MPSGEKKLSIDYLKRFSRGRARETNVLGGEEAIIPNPSIE
jgi:hypothetical protein